MCLNTEQNPLTEPNLTHPYNMQYLLLYSQLFPYVKVSLCEGNSVN